MNTIASSDFKSYLPRMWLMPSMFFTCLVGFLCCICISPSSALSEGDVDGVRLVQYGEHRQINLDNQCDLGEQRIGCDRWHEFGESPLVIPSTTYMKTNKELLDRLWVNKSEITNTTDDYLNFLRRLESEGLDPDEYALKYLIYLFKSDNQEKLAELADLANRSLIKVISDLHWGRRRYRLKDSPKFHQYIGGVTEVNSRILEHHLDQALRAVRLVDYLQDQLPHYSQYLQLKQQLGFFKELASNEEIENLRRESQDKDGDSRNPGEIKADVLAVCMKALVDLGELSVAESQKILKDTSPRTITATIPKNSGERDHSILSHPKFVRAVKGFQARMGLVPDGVLGAKTLKEILRPAAERIQTISMNLERWRWLPHSSEDSFWDTYLMVNTAGFDLVFVKEREIIDRMPVIVGTRFNRTPTFSASIEAVELNPFWNVPSSIAKNELWPKERRSPGSLERQHIRVLSGGKLRQDPGPGNALGQIKFILPNQFNVYLHDTPTKHLFNQDSRAFSHGCIRVSRPIDLALEVLNSDKVPWTREKVQALIAEGENRKFHLPREIPIHIVYRTAWVESDGKIHFRPDIYDKDRL